MKSMTKQEAHEFKDRWKFVNNFIAHQIRNTPAETKLQQLSAMFVVGQSRSNAFLSEEQESPRSLALAKAESQCLSLNCHRVSCECLLLLRNGLGISVSLTQ